MNAGPDFSLGILAGGRGRRWGGRDKGLIAFQGHPLLANVCDARSASAGETLICCRDNAYFYSHYGDRILCESTPNRGPCAGITALLSACESATLIILPTDLIGAGKQVIATLEEAWTDADRAIVLTDQHGRHSPCMRLAQETVEDCCAFIDQGGTTLRDLLTTLQARRITVESRWLLDADSSYDLLTHCAD
mgnify:FL=1